MKSLQIMSDSLPILLSSLPVTMFILFVSVAIALVIGLLLTWAKLSKNNTLKLIANIYISFMRGTPMLIQVLLAFIGIPLILRSCGISTSSWNNMVYAIFAFSLNEGAFFAEIFRSAFIAIDKGQLEAAESIGMTRMQVFTRVILPQGSASALPNITNMVIELMKNTSLGLAIGVVDMMGMAKQISYNSYGVGQTEIFIAAAVLYWIIAIVFITISNIATDYLNRCDRKIQTKQPLFKRLFVKEGAAV